MRPPAIPGHDVVRLLGRGASATVHLAVDRRRGPTAGRRVAAKVFERGDAPLAAHERAVLTHLAGMVHVVALRGWGETDSGQPYLALEPEPGGSAADLLAARGALPPDELATVAHGLLAAVASLHAAGVVHGDLKPGNVLVAGDRVVLADFGSARWRDDRGACGREAGTIAHLAPEVLAGAPPGPAADLYGVGSTLLTLLSGEEHRGGGRQAAHLDAARALATPVPDPARWEVGGDLRRLVLGLMARDPGTRLAAATGRTRGPVRPRPWLGHRRGNR